MTHIPIAILLFLAFCLNVIPCTSQQKAYSMPFTVMEYNCENLFDCRHDPAKEDYEFLPDAKRQWTFPRYWRKINSIARVIHQCGSNGNSHHLPDIISLVEVENDSVMIMLTNRSMLKEAGYRYIMTDSRDLRGVDVALLYNPLTFRPIRHLSLRVPLMKGQSPTRDILYVEGYTRNDDTLHIFTVHFPSRNGGQYATELYRIAVVKRLITAMDSVRTHDANAKIIIAGDLNDYSFNKPLKMLYANNMTNVSAKAKGRKVEGTYKHKGKWRSLDHILLSDALLSYVTDCRICDFGWLLTADEHGGLKPHRTYLGPYYSGGISDHLPLLLRMELKYDITSP